MNDSPKTPKGELLDLLTDFVAARVDTEAELALAAIERYIDLREAEARLTECKWWIKRVAPHQSKCGCSFCVEMTDLERQRDALLSKTQSEVEGKKEPTKP